MDGWMDGWPAAQDSLAVCGDTSRAPEKMWRKVLLSKETVNTSD